MIDYRFLSKKNALPHPPKKKSAQCQSSHKQYLICSLKCVCMTVLLLEGISELVAHARRKTCHFEINVEFATAVDLNKCL